VADGLFFSLFH